MSHRGVNWNQGELSGLEERHKRLFEREAIKEKNQHYKRTTFRYTQEISKNQDMSGSSFLRPTQFYAEEEDKAIRLFNEILGN